MKWAAVHPGSTAKDSQRQGRTLKASFGDRYLELDVPRLVISSAESHRFPDRGGDGSVAFLGASAPADGQR